MASASETVLLKSTLDIQGKPYSVNLTASEVYWELTTSTRASGGPYSEPLVKTENQTVKLSEILAVKLGSKDSENAGGKFQHMEMVSLNPTLFSLWVVKRCHKHKWRDRKVTFYSKDTSVIQQWVEKLQEMMIRPEFSRPKSLLVFINPISGSQRGPTIYRDKVAPLLELAGISTDIITTQRQNHARDTLMEYDLRKVDGVVCVGGDGMFTEVVHGLLNRTLRDNGVGRLNPDTPLCQPAVRVGIIPAGSTDTVAFTSNGTTDPLTATLHIVIGDNVAMDVAAVFHGRQFLKYNVSLMGYGYYGDTIVDSERNRWMGPRRYDWEGFKKIISKRVYEGEVSFLPSSDKENHVRDGTSCKAGCQVCQAVSTMEPESYGSEQGIKEEDRWQTIRGRFIAINSFVMSCRCRFSFEGPAPSAHLGDGCADLVLVHECSRIDYSKHLYRCIKKNKDQFDFPFIQTFRVRQFKFRPLVDEIDDTHDASDGKIDGQQRLRSRVSHNSVWNCDGEALEESAMDLRVHRQMIRLFGRGVEDEIQELGAGGGCLSCLNSM